MSVRSGRWISCLLLSLFMDSVGAGFVASSTTRNTLLPFVPMQSPLRRIHTVPTRLRASDENSNVEQSTDDDDDDDDDNMVKPYGNRSLTWTKRYRKLIPYHIARGQAMAMGMSTKDEYQRWRKGPYQIQRPDEMYALEWISWEEFLGAMRTYEETRQIVRLLQLQSMEDYQHFVRQDPKRAEGLRIPAKPEIVYRDCGWENPQVFFGTSDISKED